MKNPSQTWNLSTVTSKHEKCHEMIISSLFSRLQISVFWCAKHYGHNWCPTSYGRWKTNLSWKIANQKWTGLENSPKKMDGTSCWSRFEKSQKQNCVFWAVHQTLSDYYDWFLRYVIFTQNIGYLFFKLKFLLCCVEKNFNIIYIYQKF